MMNHGRAFYLECYGTYVSTHLVLRAVKAQPGAACLVH